MKSLLRQSSEDLGRPVVHTPEPDRAGPGEARTWSLVLAACWGPPAGGGGGEGVRRSSRLLVNTQKDSDL